MYNKNKTIDDFTNRFLRGDIFDEEGRFGIDPYGTSHVEINCSSILTRLIQEAGRWCRRYASDLFIDWRSIDRGLENGTLESGTHLFGFREDGVDHTEFVLSRYDRNHGICNEYRSIWRLDITIEDAEPSYMRRVRMKLYEVDR